MTTCTAVNEELIYFLIKNRKNMLRAFAVLVLCTGTHGSPAERERKQWDPRVMGTIDSVYNEDNCLLVGVKYAAISSTHPSPISFHRVEDAALAVDLDVCPEVLEHDRGVQA